MASYYSVPGTVPSKHGKSAISNAMYQPSTISQRNPSCTRSASRKSVASRRNGLDDEEDYRPKDFALQTCKDTGVGNCPACLGTRTNCHESECQLCCEVKVCGPSFRNCPFNPEAEAQTDPICDFMDSPCKCHVPCGQDVCTIGENCDFSGVQCRCIDNCCNTSKHCIILDACPVTEEECKCCDKACETNRSCIIIEDPYNDYQDVYCPAAAAYTPDYIGRPCIAPTLQSMHMMGAIDPEEIIRRCHALCQANYLPPGADRLPKQLCKPPEKICKRSKPPPPRFCRVRTKPSEMFCRTQNPPRKGCPKMCVSSPGTTSGDETDHYSIIIEEAQKELKCDPRRSPRSKSTTPGLQSDKSRTSLSGSSKNSRSFLTINSETTPQKSQWELDQKVQKPIQLVCAQPCQLRSPYCPNPAMCNICGAKRCPRRTTNIPPTC